MAEAIGLAGSLIGIAGIGSQLALTLYRFADALGSAGGEAQHVASEVSLFSSTLVEVSKIVDSTGDGDRSIHAVVVATVQACESLLVDIEGLVSDIAINKTSTRAVWISRMKWLLRKPKVLSMRSSIESCKSTLMLLMASCNVNQARQRDAPASIVANLQSTVQVLLRASDIASHKLLTPSDASLGDDSAIGSSSEIESTCDLQSVPSESTAVSITTALDLEPEPFDASTDPGTDTDTQTTALVLHVRTMVNDLAAESLRHSRGEAQWSWNSASRREERHRSQPASSHADPSKGVKVGKAVDVKDAPDIFYRPEEVQYDAGWQKEEPDRAKERRYREDASSEATRSTSDPRNHPEAAKGERPRARRSNVTEVEDTEEQIRQALWDKEDRDREERDRAVRDWERKQEQEQWEREEEARRVLEDYKRKKLEEQQEQERLKLQFKLEEEERRAEAAQKRRHEEETIARERDLRIKELELQVQTVEAARLKAEEEATALKPKGVPAPVRFKDAVGRKFSFPYDIVKTWKGMEGIIRQAFLHVDLLEPHVAEGHYDLIGPDGEILLPQIWDTLIKPDMLIEMQMWPISEEAKKHQSHGSEDLDALLKGVRLGSAKGSKKPSAPPALNRASKSGSKILSRSFWARDPASEEHV